MVSRLCQKGQQVEAFLCKNNDHTNTRHCDYILCENQDMSYVHTSRTNKYYEAEGGVEAVMFSCSSFSVKDTSVSSVLSVRGSRYCVPSNPSSQ